MSALEPIQPLEGHTGLVPCTGSWRSVRTFAIAVNAVVALFVASMVFDEIRMAHFPGFTFPFPA